MSAHLQCGDESERSQNPPVYLLPARRAGAVRGAHRRDSRRIDRAGGWLPFDRFMALALYAPGLGYYSRRRAASSAAAAESGSDFVTAPELSPLFGRALARQVAQALDASGTRRGLWSSAPAPALAGRAAARRARRARSTLLDRRPVGQLRERQRETLEARARAGRGALARRAARRDSTGVVVGNEVLDAMPVQLSCARRRVARARRASERRALRLRRPADRAATRRSTIDAAIDARRRAVHRAT